ncbi:MAG: hydroxyacid dehydrogenase [Rhizobiaceae bacterium]|nr:hydroxyacid dehydrogenase [Rhizobiaceae bacterium]
MSRRMPKCLIVQPIHPDAVAHLEKHDVKAVVSRATDEAGLLDEAVEADAAITRNAGLPRAAIAVCRRLRIIAIHGIGTDAVPVDLATESGIVVVNTPDANLQSVAEHALSLLLAVAKRLPDADRATRAGDFAFKFRAPSREVSGGVLGLVGFGKIAGRVAAMARAFGMHVVALSPNQPDEAFQLAGVERVPDLRTLLTKSDFVSLHLPLTPATRHMIGEPQLRLLRSDAILVNTSRGAIVDEIALADWLARNPGAGAGLDVFSVEPPPLDHPLLGLRNVVLSPHTAASSEAALRRTGIEAAEAVLTVLGGGIPRNVVNPDVFGRLRGLEAS